jgi:cytochrome c peroxidase
MLQQSAWSLELRLQAIVKYAAGAVALLCCLDAAPGALAQQSGDDAANRSWQRGALAHAAAMARFADRDHGAQATPDVIPAFEEDFDPSGLVATQNANGPTETADNPFFQDLGTNGRTCFTCHQPQNGWTVSALSVQARFHASYGTDPIFRLVDGATCPNDDVSTLGAKREAYRLLLNKGLIRIGLQFPAGAQFQVVSVDDPYGCNTNPATGLTGPASGVVSVYRRPLPATNLGFLSAFMWDGREPSLLSQSNDATLGHAQASQPLTAAQQQQIVAFETGLFTAQIFDDSARDLTEDGARGGPAALAQQFPSFYIGINDPLGHNPTGAPFNPNIFDLYRAWSGQSEDEDASEDRAAVARGEALFNGTSFAITGVAGLNDVLKVASITGFCGTCHDTPDVGNHSVKAPLDIGIADAGAGSPLGLDVTGLPVFTLQCVAGPLAGATYTVTDPGRALISGNCADIGKLKGPILRGLASRAPYFHNGAAKSLRDVVDFYDQRFAIGFSEQQKRDLVAFLRTL